MIQPLLLQGLYLKTQKQGLKSQLHVMFTATLFTAARRWEQPSVHQGGGQTRRGVDTPWNTVRPHEAGRREWRRDRLPPAGRGCDSTHTATWSQGQGEGAQQGCWQPGEQTRVQGVESFSLEEEGRSKDGWRRNDVTVFTARELFA